VAGTWAFNYDNDAGLTTTPTWTGPTTGVKTRFLVHWKKATAPGANNGILQIWMNGVSVFSKTDIDNDTANDPDYFEFGNIYTDGTTGAAVHYLDELDLGTAEATGETYYAAYLNETVTLADSSTEIIRKSVIALDGDGAAFTAATTIGGVEDVESTYYHDTTNSLLYVHMADSGSPGNNTVIAYFWIYFSTKGIILNSLYYEPYIASNGIPSISTSLSELHYGTAIIGAGSVVMLNGRGYFDQIARTFLWTNKTIRLLLGGDSLAYAEYTAIFTGKIRQTTFTKNEFSLEVVSSSHDLMRTIPVLTYWTSTYASLDPMAEGTPIPYFWGSYTAAQAPLCTCINTAYGANVYQFKVCDTTYHAIKSITQVYIDYGAGVGWQTIAHSNEDLALATFTISSATFVVGVSRVKVAFEGYHVASVLIEGAPEIVEDLLLNQCGYVAADLDSTSFTASKTESTFLLNVHVINQESALSVIEQICASDIAYFDENGAGQLRYRTYSPAITSSGLTVLDSTDILETPIIFEDFSEVYYRVKVGYSYYCWDGRYVYAEETSYSSLYKYKKREILHIQTFLRSASNAGDLCDKYSMLVKDLVTQVRIKLKISQVQKLLGDQFKLTLARAPYATAGGYSERVFEIKGTTLSCFPLTLELTARDSADFFLDIGVWMADAAPAWGAATQAEKDVSGFWCDASGYCDTADTSSFEKSRWW
jgi:hypothetical protein